MITDKTLDEALVELLRTKRALEALRAERKATQRRTRAELYQSPKTSGDCSPAEVKAAMESGFAWAVRPSATHAAAKRATLDLTRKLAQLRAGK